MAVDGQGLPKEVVGLGELAAAEAELADPLQYVGLAESVFRSAKRRQGTLQVLGGLVERAQIGLGGGQVGQCACRVEAVPCGRRR
jgi:hypothetical protein